MRQWLKWISISIVVLFFCFVIAVIVLVNWVDLNRFKPMIANQVRMQTGRQLSIDGDLSWTFFPSIGVKLGHLSLSNPTGFKQSIFAEVDDVRISVKLWPLLRGRIESDGINLDGMKLFLLKNRQGQVNWQMMPIAPGVKVEIKAPAKSDQSISKKQPVKLDLTIANVSVSHATIQFKDEVTAKIYDISEFELHAKNIQFAKPFPLMMAFDVKSTNPILTGHVKLTSNIQALLEKQQYIFDNTHLVAEVNQQGKRTTIEINGNIAIDNAAHTFAWTDLKGYVDKIAFTGSMDATNLSQATMNIRMALQIPDLVLAKLRANQIMLQSHYGKNVLTIDSLTANLYQGTLQGTGQVNLNGAVPQITAETKLTHVKIQPLLADLGDKSQKLTLRGIAQIDTKLSTQGSAAPDLLRNLNGTSHFSLTQGTLIGVDINYLIDDAISLLKQHQPTTNKNTQETDFGQLTGSAVIRQGIVTTTDTSLDAPRFGVLAKGDINLPTQQINMVLETSVKKEPGQRDDLRNLYGLEATILVKGKLSNPKISLDTVSLANAIAKQRMQKITDEGKIKVQEKIKKVISPEAGKLLQNLLGN